MTFEGVVCKAGTGPHPTMFKIKSQAWFDRLRRLCKTDEEFENLR